MARFLPVGKGVKGPAGFMLAAIPALGAVLTGLAITGSLVGRMARDHPLATYGAFGLAVLAIFAGAVAAFALDDGSTEERAAVYSGLALIATSLLFGVYAGVQTWGDRAQPSIMLTPKAGKTVAVTVRGTGLRSSDHIVVEVEQLIRKPNDSGRLTWTPGQPLYGASLGPDEGNTTGCVRVHVPRPQERPQLAVSWETFVRAPRLLVHLTAKNLPQRPSRSMTLRVYGIAADQTRRNLAEWSLAPNADGEFDRRLSVVVGHAFADVCVVASTSTRGPECPAPAEDGTVWSQLAVPVV